VVEEGGAEVGPGVDDVVGVNEQVAVGHGTKAKLKMQN
jgi:hypothetical protein